MAKIGDVEIGDVIEGQVELFGNKWHLRAAVVKIDLTSEDPRVVNYILIRFTDDQLGFKDGGEVRLWHNHLLGDFKILSKEESLVYRIQSGL